MTQKVSLTGACKTAGNARRPGEGFYPRAAFTLVELLVVIAIIAILAAVLLPSLVLAKMQATRIQCISNEKQLILAWSVYSGDNEERLVANGGDTSPTSTQAHLWVYGGNHGDPNTLTNDLYLTGGNYALFAKLLPAEHIYKCPADNSRWPVWNSASTVASVTELRSYAMNSYMGLPVNGTVPPVSISANYKTYTKTSQLNADSPANRFVFTDVNPGSICTPAFGVDMNRLMWIHYPSDLHRLAGVLAFADGHAEAHRWMDPRTMVHLSTGTYIQHNISSPNNRDLDWIADRTTSQK